MNTVFWVWQSHYNHDLIGNMAATLGLHKTVNSNPGLWKELAGPNSSLLNYLVMMDSGEGKLLSSVVYTSMGKSGSKLWSQGYPLNTVDHKQNKTRS